MQWTMMATAFMRHAGWCIRILRGCTPTIAAGVSGDVALEGTCAGMWLEGVRSTICREALAISGRFVCRRPIVMIENML